MHLAPTAGRLKDKNMKFKIKANGEEQEINATRQGDQLTLIKPDGETIRAEIVQNENGKVTLNLNGRMVQIAGHKDGDQRQLWVNFGTTANLVVSHLRQWLNGGMGLKADPAMPFATLNG